jgi:hypothetical protein
MQKFLYHMRFGFEKKKKPGDFLYTANGTICSLALSSVEGQ